MAVRSRTSKTQARQVACPWCDKPIDTVARSMSLFCPHCNKRVILENFNIKAYHGVKEFVTTGNVTVEKTGTLSAPTRASNVTVVGKVWGNIRALQRVEIKRTGQVRGDVVAPTLVVDEGGVLVGYCTIGVRPAAGGNGVDTPDGATGAA